jgi:hypothetical protein
MKVKLIVALIAATRKTSFPKVIMARSVDLPERIRPHAGATTVLGDELDAGLPASEPNARAVHDPDREEHS